MRQYKKYERYKDTGVEWIGDIPEHWELRRIKFIGTLYSGNGFKEELQGKEEGDYPFYKVSDINGDGKLVTFSNNYVDKDDIVNNRWNIIPQNSILFAKIGEALKKNHRKINAYSCLIDNNIAALKPHEIVLDYNYFYYYFSCINAEWFVNPGTLPSINNTYLKNFIALLPSKNEQKIIANFLDQKTAEIDVLIADKEKLIELLQEKRQAIITETVTKGLNPNVKMKDSGIEWIGEIPEHWEVSKIKFTTYVKGRIGWQGLRADEFIDEGPYLVTGTDFVDGLVNWDSCYHISMERYNEAPPIQLRENDLLITKDGTIGKVAIVKNKPKYAILNSGIFVTRPKNSAYLTEFMYWILNSQVFNKFIQYMSLGSTIVHLYQQTFENFSFPITNLNEQKTIAHFLDRKVAEIDGLISDIKLQIQKLKEYRQSLISEAVTGKIDVREFQKKNEVIFRNE